MRGCKGNKKTNGGGLYVVLPTNIILSSCFVVIERRRWGSEAVALNVLSGEGQYLGNPNDD